MLERGTHLEDALPYIHTPKAGCKRFDLPALQKYPYWFEIIKTCRSNNVVSTYTIKPNAAGDSIMSANGILKEFPAVIEHYDANARFYYFAGDFADNPIGQNFVKFRGIRAFRKLLYEQKQADDREGFFWEYYTPLVHHILDTYKPLR